MSGGGGCIAIAMAAIGVCSDFRFGLRQRNANRVRKDLARADRVIDETHRRLIVEDTDSRAARLREMLKEQVENASAGVKIN